MYDTQKVRGCLAGLKVCPEYCSMVHVCKEGNAEVGIQKCGRSKRQNMEPRVHDGAYRRRENWRHQRKLMCTQKKLMRTLKEIPDDGRYITAKERKRVQKAVGNVRQKIHEVHKRQRREAHHHNN